MKWIEIIPLPILEVDLKAKGYVLVANSAYHDVLVETNGALITK